MKLIRVISKKNTKVDFNQPQLPFENNFESSNIINTKNIKISNPYRIEFYYSTNDDLDIRDDDRWGSMNIDFNATIDGDLTDEQILDKLKRKAIHFWNSNSDLKNWYKQNSKYKIYLWVAKKADNQNTISPNISDNFYGLIRFNKHFERGKL